MDISGHDVEDVGDAEDLVGRLRVLGRAPVRPEVERQHLAAMATADAGPVAVVERRWRFGWRSVAAAGVVGFLAGSTGLAAAGNLPGPAQDVAHSVLGHVGLDVPRSREGCPEGKTYRNHGEYVSEVEAAGGDVEAAARSNCGKPDPEGKGGKADRNGEGRGTGTGGRGQPADRTPRPDADGDPCTGPPPWAGTHLPPDQKAALQEQRKAQCGADAEAPTSEESTTTTG